MREIGPFSRCLCLLIGATKPSPEWFGQSRPPRLNSITPIRICQMPGWTGVSVTFLRFGRGRGSSV